MFYDLSRGIVNLKIEHLYYLREISNCRSISAAAKRLFIGQTTLSAIVKSMEEDLGGSLYNRTPGGVELTKEGEFFQQFADEILAKYDAMLDLFKSASSMQKINFIGDATACRYFSIYLSKLLTAASDTVSLTVHQLPRRNLLSSIIDGYSNLGAGFFDPHCEAPKLYERARKSGIDVMYCGCDRFYLCVRSDNEKFGKRTVVDVSELTGEPYAAPQFYSTVPNGTSGEEALRGLRCVVTLPSTELVLRSVATCNYIAVLSGHSLIQNPTILRGEVVAIPLSGFPAATKAALLWFSRKRSELNSYEKILYDALSKLAINIPDNLFDPNFDSLGDDELYPPIMPLIASDW